MNPSRDVLPEPNPDLWTLAQAAGKAIFATFSAACASASIAANWNATGNAPHLDRASGSPRRRRLH
jgi:hypothetical protein